MVGMLTGVVSFSLAKYLGAEHDTAALSLLVGMIVPAIAIPGGVFLNDYLKISELE